MNPAGPALAALLFMVALAAFTDHVFYFPALGAPPMPPSLGALLQAALGIWGFPMILAALFGWTPLVLARFAVKPKIKMPVLVLTGFISFGLLYSLLAGQQIRESQDQAVRCATAPTGRQYVLRHYGAWTLACSHRGQRVIRSDSITRMTETDQGFQIFTKAP